MTPENQSKQKIFAVLFVVLLFLLVGSLFLTISIKNKKKTENLKNTVLKQKKEQDLIRRLGQITSSTSTESILTSKSFITILVTNNGTEKILAEKNSNLVLPIASLTKLLVALVTVENLDLEAEVTVTTDYIGLEESAFILEPERRYKVKDLLANALISSDNDSARLLASILGTENFVSKMNNKATELGLTQTHFVNPTGLDPIDLSSEMNVSTATDLVKLLIYIKNNQPSILKITTKDSYEICDTGNYCKVVLSTNKLLTYENFPFRIIGGKTGNTELAGKNLVLINSISSDIFLINIVLGAENNFTDTISLINNIKIKN